MKKFVKNYIGKGKKVEGLEIIKINLKISDIVKFAHKYNDEDYISLEVAKLQNTDNFGHDYTVYVNRLEEALKKAGKTYDFHRYDGAGHAFFNASRRSASVSSSSASIFESATISFFFSRAPP